MIGYVTLGADGLDRARGYYDELLGSEVAPGYRGDFRFGYYFAYFRDPDGHKFAVFNIAPQPA